MFIDVPLGSDGVIGTRRNNSYHYILKIKTTEQNVQNNDFKIMHLK